MARTTRTSHLKRRVIALGILTLALFSGSVTGTATASADVR